MPATTIPTKTTITLRIIRPKLISDNSRMAAISLQRNRTIPTRMHRSSLRNLHSPSTDSRRTDSRITHNRHSPPYYQQQAQPRYEQPSYNQPPIYAQQTYYQAAQQQPGYGYAQKSKIVAGLLGLFLGGLGVHNFYLGYTGKAVAQLLLTLIGWIILIGPIISGIWALIESVLILCSSYGSNWHRDGRGQELQD